jgi:histidyl-tRNA synthetase
MKINSRSLLAALLSARGFAPERHEGIYAVLDKRDKIPAEAFEEEIKKVAANEQEKVLLLAIGQARGKDGLEQLETVACGNEAAQTELVRLGQLFEHLAAMGVADFCNFDMGVVRGLAYYTGVVFEAFGKGELKRAICGGGRYDRLLEVLGGPPMSGVGFGTSDVVILDLLADVKRLPEPRSTGKRLDFFVIDVNAGLFPVVVATVARLRRSGYAAEFSYRRQNIGKQLQQASSSQAARTVIIGSEYQERGLLTIKDLASGRQSEVPIDAFWSNPPAWPKPDTSTSVS